MTFWFRAQQFPPILCRLLARLDWGRALGTLEIAAASQLSPAQVEGISQCTSWDGVSFQDMAAFLRGCRIDFCDSRAMRRVDDYLRKSPAFRHLTTSPEWEAYYQPMLKRWRHSYGVVNGTDTHIWEPIRALLIRLNPLVTA